MRRDRQTRPLISLLLAVIGTLLVSSGQADAAPDFSVSPSPADVGSTVQVTGSGWMPGSTITISVGPQGGQADSSFDTTVGPNSSFEVSFDAPGAAGTWDICGSGSDLGAQFVYVCAPLTTRSNAPNTTNTGTTTTTTVDPAPVDTGDVSDTIVPNPTPAPPTSSGNVVPPAGTPDGAAPVVDDPGSSVTDRSGVGLAAGIGLGVVGLAVGLGAAKGLLGGTARPGVGIGIVIGTLAGSVGVIVATGPDKANVPPLGIVQVQTTATLNRGAPDSTLVAACPAGMVVLGGGYTSDWSSKNYSDLGYLIEWLETEDVGSKLNPPALTFMYPPASTFELSGTLRSKYFSIARRDGSVHLADQVYDSKQETWLSWYQRSSAIKMKKEEDSSIRVPEPVFIFHSDAVAEAAADAYYYWHEFLREGYQPTAGLMVHASMPTGVGWSVTASLSKISLVPYTTVSVTAICAPIAPTTGDPGVIGARIVTNSTNGSSAAVAECAVDEFVASTGWAVGPLGSLGLALREDGAVVSWSRVTYSLNMAGATQTALAVCVKKQGLASTVATGTAMTLAGRDGAATATCPSGYTALGGGFSLLSGVPGDTSYSVAHTVLGAGPSGPKSFTTKVRGALMVLRNVASSARPADYGGEWNLYLNEDHNTISQSSITAQVVCGKRTL